MKNKFNNMTDEIWKQSNEVSKESREGFSDEQIKELRKAVQSMNSEFEVLENGTDDAIELDPDNEAHVEWMNDQPPFKKMREILQDSKEEDGIKLKDGNASLDKNLEYFKKFSTTFNNTNKVDTLQICREIRKVPRLNVVNDKVQIDENNTEQVKWFEKFKREED